MRQRWGSVRENESYAPWREVQIWRRRFWWLVILDMIVIGLLLILLVRSR